MTAKHVASPAGTIRIYVAGADTTETRKAARSLACKIHGGISVGFTPKAERANRGHVWTFTPVTSVKPAPKAAPKAAPRAPKAAPVATDDVKALKAQLLQLTAQLTALTGTSTSIVQDAPKAPKAPRVVPPAVQARIDARAAVVCTTCADHGHVRKAGPRAGQAYRTADGAKAATANGNSVPCPTHKRAGRKSA